jgi:8-amino-7-oxononanoate synthase
LADAEKEEISITYLELDQQARAIATHLQASGATGSRALLLYPSGLDYIVAFFGCLYAGVVAVPAYPPRRNKSLDRIDGIVTNAEATHVLGTGQILSDIERRFSAHPHLQAMRRIATDQLDMDTPSLWTPPRVSGEDLAFLQYTSGSTGRPKGVMVSHDNLLHNQRLMHEAFQLDEKDRLIAWLPLFHDMGLVGNVLHSLYAGVHCVFMAPVMFLQKPIRWLQGISRYQAAISGAPNFAYDLCVRKTTPEQREGLDLRSWRLALNGSEPIRAETLNRFSETFAEYGFRRASFFPCYGLAEATLFVSGGPRHEEPRVNQVEVSALAENRICPVAEQANGSYTLVSSGRAWPDQRVQIVDPETLKPCPTISGDSVAQGYWKRPTATEETFGSRVAESHNGRVLRTGDLGFLHEGELFVTGRLKDLIIIRGRNHYPHDIEATVGAAHPALRDGCGAAFGIEVSDEEHLAVVQEVRRTALRDLDVASVANSIREAVADEHDLHAHTVVLLKTGSLPKTTSRKIQRRKCKNDLLTGQLNEVGRIQSESTDSHHTNGFSPLNRADLLAIPQEMRGPQCANHLQHQLARSRRIPASKIDLYAPMAILGLDSLELAELKVTIESDLELVAPPRESLHTLSIAQLGHQLADQLGPETSGTEETPEETNSVATDLFAKCDTEGGYFGAYRRARDKYFTQPVLDGPIGPRMRFDGKDVIVWSINDYLGLARHPHILERARQALETDGTSAPMGSRLMTGNTDRHMALESRLARFLDREAAIVFNFGYLGVLGTINALVEEADTVLIDSLSHACIVDGALLASRGKQFRVFRHNDTNSLEDQLRIARANRRGGLLIVTEGVFGMTGDQAPLPEMCELKDRYDARLFIDDAHGFGVMGATGAGTAEHQGVQDRVDLYFGTFAKSFAAIGGVTAGEERVVDYIRYNARPNVFAKSLPMVYVEAVDAALDIIETGHERRDWVWHIARRLQQGLAELGFDLGDTSSPITPVYVPAGDEETAVRAMKLMRSDYGVFVSAVTYPVVPRGVVLFRLTATAAHTDEDVDHTLEAFCKLRDHMRLNKTAQVFSEP